ncbi:MAG: hypothetical protein ACI4T8_04285 [Christensenellales bacterium]
MKNLLLNFNDWFVSFREKFYKWFTASGVTYRDGSEYLYKTTHLLILFSVIALTIAIYFIYRKKNYNTKRNFLIGCAWLMITCEIFTRFSKILFHADLGQLTTAQLIKDILPIHFCQVMIWVVILSIIFNNKPMMSFGAVCGAIGCLIYLVYPIEGLDHSFFNLRMLNSPLTHGLGFICCSNMILWNMAELKLSDMWKTYVFLFCLLVYGCIMNLIFKGENYMFMVTNPTNISFGKIPYQIVLCLMVAIIVALIYLIPYWINCLKQKHKQTQNV